MNYLPKKKKYPMPKLTKLSYKYKSMSPVMDNRRHNLVKSNHDTLDIWKEILNNNNDNKVKGAYL